MIYKIVVDKQPMTNPSGEKKEYEIDIDELHFKRDVYDSLVITHDEDYVMRRLSLSEYNVLTELDPPIKEPLEDVNIELFEGENYIYLYDMTGNRIVAQYLVKNEFNELYITQSEMNSAIEQKANKIAIAVSETYSKKTDVISEVNVEYALGTSTSTAPTTGWSTIAPTWQSGKYMWQRTTTIFADGSTDVSTPTCIAGAKGQDGTNGIGISSIVNKYAVSSSNSTAPSSWSNTPQTMTATNKYLWNYEIITYSNNTTYTSTPAVIGTYGEKGDKGNTGTGVKDVVAEYYLSSSNTTQTGGSWSTSQPKYKDKYYYWTRTKITWTDNTTTYTTPILVEEINSLNESVASLNIRAGDIESTVRTKVGKTEVGTYIQQNTEAVKVAWNQISEFIQMMIINNNASLAILDKNKNLLMSLDKEGQHFYKNDGTTVFGKMGVNKIDDKNYISFSVPTDYNKSIEDGMAWGVITKSDGKFWPIMYVKNFNMPQKNSGGCTGELILDGCDLVLGAINSGIITGNIKIHGDAMPGIFFSDSSTGEVLLSINPSNVIQGATISILGNISFYKNQAGSNSFKIGNDENNYCLFTDDGSIHGSQLAISDRSNGVYIDPNGKVSGNALYFYELPTYQGYKLVYGQSGHKYFLNWTGSQLQFWVDTTNVGTLSDKRLKTEIQDIDEDFIKAIEEIEMKQFKVANRNGLISFGILAQDLIEIFKKYGKKPFDYEIVYKTQYRTDDDTVYYAINYEQFLILKQKATDKKLEQLQEKDKQKDEIIANLIERLEKLEKEANNGQD